MILWSIGTLKHWSFIKTHLPEYVSWFAKIATDTIGSLVEIINTKTVASFLDKKAMK